MAAALARPGFTGGAGELTRAQLAQYWLGATIAREASTRAMLRAFQGAGGAHDRRRRAGRRAGLQVQGHPFPLQPYGESEWAALTDACAAVVADSYRAHRAALAGATRGADRQSPAGAPATCAGSWPGPAHVRTRGGQRARGLPRCARPRRIRPGQCRAFPARRRRRQLPAAAGGVFGCRSRRHRRPAHHRHRLGRGCDGPVVVCEGAHRRRERQPAQAGGPATGAVAGPFGAAAGECPARGASHLWLGSEGPEPIRCAAAPGPSPQPGLGAAASGPRRRRRAAEDPAGSDPHHSPGDARQQRLVGQQTGGDRPEPHSAGGGRPLPVGADVGAAAAGRHRHRWRPA